MPGFADVDLVSHSGNSASGEFGYSLSLPDVHTEWNETRAVLGKGAVWDAFAGDSAALAFPLGGSIRTMAQSSSTGTAATGVLASCAVSPTARPYKKDDNAYVEQ
jgi:hypothetical protein